MFYSLQRGDALKPPAGPGEKRAAFRSWPAVYHDRLVVVSPDTWSLEVGGMVTTPKHFTWPAFSALPKVTQHRRLVWAEGWSYRADWEGVLFYTVLEQVRPVPGATHVLQTDYAGHQESISMRAALETRSIFCLRESGAPLDPLHGGPCRLMLFDRYAHKGLGPLRRLEFITQEQHEQITGSGEARGYDPEGHIEPGSYYAVDLKDFRPVHHPGEVTAY